MSHVPIQGVDLYYQSEGEGVPILFIHGGVAGPEPRFHALHADGAPRLTTPEAALAVLARDARFVSYHRRGHGLSGVSPGAYRIEDLAADASALLDHLDVQQAVVIGHSLGGMVALQLALDAPNRVARLCLASTGAGLLSSEDRFGRGNLAHFYANVSSDVALSKTAGLRSAFEARREGLRRTSERAPAGMAEWLASLDDDELCAMYGALLRDCEAFLDVDLSARLAELRIPVAVIHGGADRWVPIAHGRHLHGSIAHAIWLELPDAGHANLLDLADGLRAVARFVGSDGVAGARAA